MRPTRGLPRAKPAPRGVRRPTVDATGRRSTSPRRMRNYTLSLATILQDPPEGTNAGNVTGLAIGELREPLRTPTPLGYALPQTHVSDARTIAGGGAGVATLGRKGAALLWIRPPVSLRANRSCGAAVGAKTIVSPGVAALGAVEPGGRSWRSGSRV